MERGFSIRSSRTSHIGHQYSIYQSPLAHRYSSKEMLYEHSDLNKYLLWRKLWIWLAESQLSLGLQIRQDQIDEMKSNLEDIDIKSAEFEERNIRNEVAAHIIVFGKQCPKAAPIINLGATAYYITDNADLIIMRNSVELILHRVVTLIYHMKNFAETYKDVPTVGFIHMQPTQMTTVGKRVCMWINDLLMDESALKRCKNELRFLGIKGAIGTQYNILEIFDGNIDKVRKLDQKIARCAGFDKLYMITGQTYTRKVEVEILAVLSGLGATIHKVCSDIRILTLRKVVEERAIGPITHRRYPNRSERCCSLSRYLITVYANAANTHANQWLEGTFDDSSVRHLSVPESFLCADAALIGLRKTIEGLVIYPPLINRYNTEELPYIAVDNLINAMIKVGVEKAEVEPKLRGIMSWAALQLKQVGKIEPSLVERIKNDEYFKPISTQFEYLFDPSTYIGRAADQVTHFINEEVNPVLLPYGDNVMLF